MSDIASISTDQIAAFVELARQGSIRAAAEVMHITEQGLRNRLLALESRLGVQLYRKSRGVRRVTPLTLQGSQFLPHAITFLERADDMCRMFSAEPPPHDVNVVASQYLIAYVLIDVVQKFHADQPNVRIHLTARTEQEIEQTLMTEPEIAIGVAAPYEGHTDLSYEHLFSMNWSLITPRRHRLLGEKAIGLSQLVDEALILYERGSTGRMHVMDAFGEANLSPVVAMEATNTDIIVRMVEAGLGVSIVPLLPSGVVTRGHRVGIRSLEEQVRPIRSGILVRRGEQLSASARLFTDFIRRQICTTTRIEKAKPKGKKAAKSRLTAAAED